MSSNLSARQRRADDCRIGTFYKSLLKQKAKYENYISDIGSPSENGSDAEDAGTGEDGGDVPDGRGGRLLGRRGAVNTEEAADEEEAESKPARKGAAKKASTK